LTPLYLPLILMIINPMIIYYCANCIYLHWASFENFHFILVTNFLIKDWIISIKH